MRPTITRVVAPINVDLSIAPTNHQPVRTDQHINSIWQYDITTVTSRTYSLSTRRGIRWSMMFQVKSHCFRCLRTQTYGLFIFRHQSKPNAYANNIGKTSALNIITVTKYRYTLKTHVFMQCPLPLFAYFTSIFYISKYAMSVIQ